MPGKRTFHCTTQLVALSTIGWYYIRKITTEDFITYWYGGKLESDLSYINLALHTNIVPESEDTSFLLNTKFKSSASFYGCIAHFVSDLVLNPNTDFLMPWLISSRIERVKKCPYCLLSSPRA